MNSRKRHDPISEGMGIAAIAAGIVAWIYFRASPELPAAAAWWRIYTGSFVEWLPGYCKPTQAGAAITLGLCLMIPLMFGGIRFSEWLYITSLRSQKRRAQRISALVDGRPPPILGSPAKAKTKTGAIERAHEVLRKEKHKS